MTSIALAAGCIAAPASESGSPWGAGGKADGASIEIAVPAAADGEPGVATLDPQAASARTRLVVEPAGEPPAEGEEPWQLQIHVRSDIYRRASYIGERPTIVMPVDGGEPTYEVVIRNHTARAATVHLISSRVEEPKPGMQMVFNAPDCDADCRDDRPMRPGTGPSNGLREELLDAIQGARQSIDFAIFGLDDRAIQQSLCHAALGGGVELRLVTDWRSLDPRNSRGYYEALEQLAQCISPLPRHVDDDNPLTEEDFAERGVQFVMNNAIMHHKFFIIDRDTPHELLVTGSANQTTTGIERNHNHMVFLRGVPGMVESYANEFEQLSTHCRNNTDRRGRACTECTATCINNVAAEGPWTVEDENLGRIEITAHFSPSQINDPNDDSLRVLRGPVASRRVWISKRGTRYCVIEDSGPAGAETSEELECVEASSSSTADLAEARARAEEIQTARESIADPRCNGPDATCACHRAGSGKWSCDYCGGASGEDWGLLSSPERRVLVSLFAGTDLCFGHALGRAAAKGVPAVAIFDRVNSFGEYTRDDYVCAMGVETYVDDWANESALIFNHNKLIVVDDFVFDGSMNISASGLEKNNENTAVYRSAGVANVFAEYIESEAALLRRRGVRRRMNDLCVEEPIGDICTAMDAEIGELESRGDAADAERIAGLRSGLTRCRAEAEAWSARCAAWEADPEAFVAEMQPSLRESGLWESPKSLRDCECNDHADQGGDGLVDQDLPHCGETWCFDQDDNDGDGLIDAIDPDCAAPGE